MIVAGVLSGTSLDGIDVAVVDVRPAARTVLAFETLPFAPDLRRRVLAAYPPAPLDALTFVALHAAIGEAFGDAVAAVCRGRGVALVGSHGVTLAHDGPAAHSLQLGDAFRIRERVGATVAFDFRAADCAAGGHGAPLVPYLDALLFEAGPPRVALNLGGIANLSVVTARGGTPTVLAFDCGPANLPIDTYVAQRGLGDGRCDRDGRLALAGAVDRALLGDWLDDPYFALAPPKSTGRERFGAPFIAAYRARLDALAPADAVATLTALCVHSVAAAIERHAPPEAAVVVSGGGVHNPALLAGLRAALAPRAVMRGDAVGGVDPDAKEALLFAVLAYELVRGRPANMPNVTGSSGARLLGAIAPYELAALEAALRREEER